MIHVQDICLSYGNQTIFNHISSIFNSKEHIGLVGRNGAGKTTFLRAILEPDILDSGTITIQKSKKVAYLPQEVVLQSNLSVLDETATAPGADEEFNEAARKAEAKRMLMGLGFTKEQFDVPVSSLSGGWKMRVVLAKLLLQKADFYLFDEPTNHLDLMAKEWFLSFLKTAPFGFILICHEKYFLDELCDKIFELERGNGTTYTGNYSRYITEKEHALELLHAAHALQQRDIARKQATIDRFRASASKAAMAKSMEKSLAKTERIEIPPSAKNVSFTFPPVQQAGKIVLKVSNVAQSFGSKTIFKNVSFEVPRGMKVALIAPNGVGKTTLFNIITGALPLQSGSINFGHNVHSAIFAQDQTKVLKAQETIIDNIKELCPQVQENRIRTFLGSFLFSGDDVRKKVAVLSGGEKNRVGMVAVLLQEANLLLLDEPTNHLDIPSKEILLKALQSYTGTIIFVCHDRDFIQELATMIIELTPTGVITYQGDYAGYMHYSTFARLPHQEAPRATVNQQEKTIIDNPSNLYSIEQKISKLEQQIKKLGLSFTELEYGTPEFAQATKKLQELKKELAGAEELWHKITEA